MFQKICTRKMQVFFIVLVGVLLIFVGCKTKDKDIVEYTREVEAIISEASSGKAVAEGDVDKIPFSESFKEDFFNTALPEPNASQLVRIIGNPLGKEEVITLGEFLGSSAESQKQKYQSFLERQVQTMGLVQPAKKLFSKSYEKDGLAYVFVKAPFHFEKLVIADKEYPVKECVLYRSYLWQKVENKWQLAEYRQTVDFDLGKMNDFFSEEIREGTKKEVEKFLTIFGESVKFEE